MSDKFDLTILPVKPSGTEKKLKRELHPNLPDIATGQLGILISPVKTGKSTIISNLLLNKNFFADMFDIVYIISNTIHNDQTSRFLKEQFPDTIWDEYSDNIIENIVKYQTSFPKDKQPFIAVILDDFLGIKSKAQIYNLATRFRHYNIGLLLFASQLFRGLPAVIRQNATFAILGGPNPNHKELLKMSEEFGSRYGGDENFLKLYHEATAKRYNFLYLDLQSNPSKAYRNFTDLIYENTSNMDNTEQIMKIKDKTEKEYDGDIQGE
tara:strand:- start:21 stop:821 length:801 start_codon:yes stop_codon:yes gene_type:complete